MDRTQYFSASGITESVPARRASLTAGAGTIALGDDRPRLVVVARQRLERALHARPAALLAGEVVGAIDPGDDWQPLGLVRGGALEHATVPVHEIEVAEVQERLGPVLVDADEDAIGELDNY